MATAHSDVGPWRRDTNVGTVTREEESSLLNRKGLCPNCCRKGNTSRKEKERKLTWGTWCSTCLRGGREGAPAVSGTFRNDRLQSKSHSPLYSSHSCHSSPRATCLGDRWRRRPEPTDMRLKPREEGRSGGHRASSLTAHTSVQGTSTHSSV